MGARKKSLRPPDLPDQSSPRLWKSCGQTGVKLARTGVKLARTGVKLTGTGVTAMYPIRLSAPYTVQRRKNLRRWRAEFHKRSHQNNETAEGTRDHREAGIPSRGLVKG